MQKAVSCSMERHRPRVRPGSVAAVWLLALTTAGCSSAGSIVASTPAASSGSTPAAATVSASASPTPSAKALDAYRAFWTSIPMAAAAPPEQRRAILAPYAADPELQSLLDGMQRQDQHGQTIYGANVPRPRVESFSLAQAVAVIRDCQDSSHSGVENKATHQLLTVGTPRNLVVTTMRLSSDGQWRVAYVTYPKSSC